jgi:hypothetical protein
MAAPKIVPPWFPWLFVIVGAYIVLLSLGLLPYAPNPRRRAFFDSPQHWQITCFGIAFFCAGLSLIVANRGRWLPALVGTVTMAALIAPMAWFFYFSGAVGLPMQLVASIPLAIGAAGAVFGVVRTAQGKSPTVGVARDPVHDAEVLIAHGRTAQARAVLLDAMRRNPSRAAVFQRKLDEIHRDA